MSEHLFASHTSLLIGPSRSRQRSETSGVPSDYSKTLATLAKVPGSQTLATLARQRSDTSGVSGCSQTLGTLAKVSGSVWFQPTRGVSLLPLLVSSGEIG